MALFVSAHPGISDSWVWHEPGRVQQGCRLRLGPHCENHGDKTKDLSSQDVLRINESFFLFSNVLVAQVWSPGVHSVQSVNHLCLCFVRAVTEQLLAWLRGQVLPVLSPSS